jgi:hypothetical protein
MTSPRQVLQFPRGSDIERFIAWKNRAREFEVGSSTRAEAMAALRRLVTRLALHSDFQDIVIRMTGTGRYTSRHRDLVGHEPPDGLMRELYRVLRMHGYITRDGTQRVPLTGLQLLLIRSAAHGRTMTSVAETIGCSPRRLRDVAGRAYRDHGCLGQADMVGCAYRNQWLPTHRETADLFAMSRYIMAPGYLINDTVKDDS